MFFDNKIILSGHYNIKKASTKKKVSSQNNSQTHFQTQINHSTLCAMRPTLELAQHFYNHFKVPMKKTLNQQFLNLSLKQSLESLHSWENVQPYYISLTNYEFLIFGSKHPTVLFTYH